MTVTTTTEIRLLSKDDALAALPDLVVREQIKSPALIVIGEVTAREDAAVAALAEAAT